MVAGDALQIAHASSPSQAPRFALRLAAESIDHAAPDEQWLLCRSGDSWRLSTPSPRSCGNNAKTGVGYWQANVCRPSTSTAAHVVKAVQRIKTWDGDGENTNCFLLVSVTVHIKPNPAAL
ncbi:hypothetical protein TgHK011_000525 [Trichoderma gracile]|nr:hypothetical protein TgHK011_000525 [Trichoderma gracile]